MEANPLPGNPFVDQLCSDRLATAAAEGEPSAVHPSGDGVVVLLRHQEREGEPAQHSFCGAPPVGVLVADVEEFTGIGKVLSRQPEGRAQLRTHLDLLHWQVVGAVLQAGEFRSDVLALSLKLFLVPDRIDDCGVKGSLVGAQPRAFGGGQSGQVREVPAAGDRFQPRIGDGGVEQRPGTTTLFGLGSRLAGQSLQLADAVSALVRTLLDEGFAFMR